MRKRKLTKQIASFGMAIVMAMGCLSNVQMTAMAQTASETEVADEVTSGTNAAEVKDYNSINSEIYDNLELYPTGGLDGEDVVFEDAIKVESVEEYYSLINGNVAMMSNDTAAASVTYPSEVDNSTNENATYLPEVITQGYSGSCVSFAYIYNLGSYTLNKARGISSKDNNNVLSPWFAHNIIRATSPWSDGSWGDYANVLIEEIGVPTLEFAPCKRSVWNTSAGADIYTWYPTEEAWNSATDNTVETVVSIDAVGTSLKQITSPDDSDLDVIKATLSSGNIISFCTGFATLNYTTIPAESPSHAGEKAVDRCDYVQYDANGDRAYGGHAMVIVGYDDTIWTDVNLDGIQQTGEFGALKFVNSHGKVYGDSGFMWVAYDALNLTSSVITDDDAARVNAAIDAGELSGYAKIQNEYRERFLTSTLHTYIASGEQSASSGCRLVATINTDDRMDVVMQILATNKADGSIKTYRVPVFKSSVYRWRNWAEDFALDGSTSATDGTFVIDLDNVISDITPDTVDNYTWSVSFSDYAIGTTPLTIKDLCIKVDGERSLAANITNDTLNGTTETYTMIQAPLYVEALTVSNEGPISLYDDIELNATAVAGSGNYEYRFGTIFNGVEYEMSSGYQQSSTITSTNYWLYNLINGPSAEAVGTHTLFVDVRDTETGDIARATIENFEVKALEITEFNASPESSQKVGTAINLSATVDYSSNHSYNTAYFYAIKDGVETRISNSPFQTGTSVTWTPTESGNYTLKCVYYDYLSQEATAYMDYKIVGENLATIYYNNSWSQAYIHYKVGNGSWTSVPGVKMDSDSSKTGYQWKYVIDMADADETTVCFNNGNGTWDSRNGANYTVGVGTYGIKNNTVEEINDELTVDLTANKTVGGTFNTTTFIAQAGNGTEPYTYQFAMVFAGTTPSSYTTASTTNTYNHYPTTAGDYTLYVIATDAAGKTAKTSKTYTVEGPKWTTFTATAADHKVGTTVTIDAELVNTQYDKYNLYGLEIEKNGETIHSDSSVVGHFTWTPEEAGTYTITAQYKLYSGTVYETSMTYEVYDSNSVTVYYSNSSWSQAYIHYQVGSGSWTSVPGVKMVTNTNGNGYTWVYEIDLGTATKATVCFNNGNNSWDSNNSSNYTLSVGKYGIKNSSVEEIDDKLGVTLSADKAVGGTYTATNFTVKGTSGTAPYTYKLAVLVAGVTPTDSSYFTIGSTGVYAYTPYTEGDYVVYAKVIDANGDTAVTSMKYSVEGPQWKSFTATASDNLVGTPVTLEAEFVNYVVDQYNSYSFIVEKDGVSNTYYAGSTGYYVWTPTEEGTYTITAVFSTYTGSKFEKQMTYEVSEEKANTVTVYYNSSWTNANIHYCVAGGSWTSVPGVAMTKTSEKSGYTHKFVIDLGDATSATICFNDGNGSWDSRNGSNYTVYAGTYGVSGGNVYKLN